MILVDTNVLIDVFDRDPQWFDWSRANLSRSAFGAYLFVNPVVIGELAAKFEAFNDLRMILVAMLISVEPLSDEGAFLAGRAFEVYRGRRGPDAPKSALPDFLIGGHAQAVGATVMTRDPRWYRTYFPAVPLITPEREPND